MSVPDSSSLYQRAMGLAFDRLAPALARFHGLSGCHRFHGEVTVEAPANLFGRLLARALRAPQHAAHGAIVFELNASPVSEVWTRHFPALTMQSTLSQRAGLIEEHSGAARLGFALQEVDGGLVMRLQHLHFWGVACPAWLRPQVIAEEKGLGDALHFHVQATVPWVGRVVHYRGHLVVPGAEDAKAVPTTGARAGSESMARSRSMSRSPT